MLRLLVRTVVFVVITLLAAQLAKAETNVLFIFDSSGSMKKKLASGETRFAVAQQAMAQALSNIPPDVRLGLLLYGHRKSRDCTDIELVSPIGADDQAAIAGTITSLKPKGETPIADALIKAIRNFAAFKGQSNRIVLITDGIEECGGDPCAAAQAVVAAGLDLKVDVVGFTLTEQQAQTIQCIADTTGGQYYDAGDVTSLTNALTQVAQTAAIPQPPARPNLLDPKEGGQLLIAPGDGWLAANDGVPGYNGWLGVAAEGVYAFRDERPAIFDRFTVYVPETNGVNLKEFELLVGEEGPTGSFRSIGTFATQNAKMVKSPYQEFTFPPVTGRYLKVKVLSSHNGGDSATTEFQLFGELSEAAASTAQAAPAASAMTNLLDPKEGGQLLIAPGDGWLAANDGVPGYNGWLGVAAEGVYAFRDERPAIFDRFTVYVPETNGVNLKEFELLVGEEGPTGSFRSIGTFATQNAKMVKSPYQEFTFPPVTGRYLKVKVLSSHNGGDSATTEFQLFGELGQ